MIFKILFILLLSFNASAEEGFHENPEKLPQAVRKHWDSIFKLQEFYLKKNKKGKVIGTKVGHGTASIIGRKGNKVYLLTAQHVLKGMGCKGVIAPSLY